MKNYEKCNNCKEYHWSDQACDPAYNVYHEDYMGDEPKVIRATSHKEAARGYAQYYNDDDDYPLMNDTIEVKVEKDGEIKFFTVGAEPDIHYTSSEIEKLTDSN